MTNNATTHTLVHAWADIPVAPALSVKRIWGSCRELKGGRREKRTKCLPEEPAAQTPDPQAA